MEIEQIATFENFSASSQGTIAIPVPLRKVGALPDGRFFVSYYMDDKFVIAVIVPTYKTAIDLANLGATEVVDLVVQS